jgi:Mycothiol maleylpyruvate isomerase N-terminal domain
MAIPTKQPFVYKSLFEVENDRLSTLLRSLTPSDWYRSTPCPGWNVHGLALHLLGGSFSVISWLRDGFRGTPAPNDSDEQGSSTGSMPFRQHGLPQPVGSAPDC